MDALVQWLVRRRLEDGRLPRGRITDVQHAVMNGLECDGCGALITKTHKAVTGVSVDDWRDIRMHVECFDVWDSERGGRGCRRQNIAPPRFEPTTSLESWWLF